MYTVFIGFMYMCIFILLANEGGEASVTRNLRHKLYVLRPELMDHYLW